MEKHNSQADTIKEGQMLISSFLTPTLSKRSRYLRWGIFGISFGCFLGCQTPKRLQEIMPDAALSPKLSLTPQQNDSQNQVIKRTLATDTNASGSSGSSKTIGNNDPSLKQIGFTTKGEEITPEEGTETGTTFATGDGNYQSVKAVEKKPKTEFPITNPYDTKSRISPQNLKVNQALNPIVNPEMGGVTVQPVNRSANSGTMDNQEIPKELNLPTAITRSLLSNPDLTTLRGQLNVNQAMVGVSKVYPWNPFVQAEYFPTGRPFVASTPGQPASGAGYANYYIWVMQRFEIAHQRRYRVQSAMAGMNQTQWNIFQGELLNISQTSRLYFTLLYQKELVKLAKEIVSLNDSLEKTIEARFKGGLAKAAEFTTAQVAARQARRQLALAETNYQIALRGLIQQLNLPSNHELVIQDRLTDFQWHTLSGESGSEDITAVAAQSIEGRPDILAAQAGFRVSLANYQLAKAAMIPDIQAGPIYQTADDTTSYLGFRFQMDIPVFNSGAPLRRQRLAEMNQQNLTVQQLKQRALREAESALTQFEEILKMVKKMQATSTDSSKELALMTKQFEAGQTDILSILTLQTNLVQEQRAYIDLLNQLAQAAANVVQTTGLPPVRIVQSSAQNPAVSDSGTTPPTSKEPVEKKSKPKIIENKIPGLKD